MLKYTEQEVRDHIRRYGTDRASDDVKEVAKDMAAEEFDVLKHQKLPMFEMPNGKHLFVWYNRETDTLNAGPFYRYGYTRRTPLRLQPLSVDGSQPAKRERETGGYGRIPGRSARGKLHQRSAPITETSVRWR